MKTRRHKNNRTFLITFQTRIFGRKTRTTAKQNVIAVGTDVSSVLRGFLFGRDASNITTNVREAGPALWGGRLVVSEFNGVPTTICPV